MENVMTDQKEAQSIKSKELGFGTKNYNTYTRFLNKDGSVNIKRKGTNFLESIDVFHALITMSWGKFLLLVMCSYFIINALFASAYYLIGVEHFGNLTHTNNFTDFMELFFFSAQTLTTVGYGYLYPKGNLAGSLAAIESMMGLMGFALATGILYGRFSRPRSYLLYSNNILLSPYENSTGIMFRITNPKQNELIETEAQVVLSMIHPKTGQRVFEVLDLEIKKISFLALSWTIVHPISPESPLFGFTQEDYKQSDAEFLIIIKAINDTYSQTVFSRKSYKYEDMVFGAKFVPLTPRPDKSGKVNIQIQKVHEFNRVNL